MKAPKKSVLRGAIDILSSEKAATKIIWDKPVEVETVAKSPRQRPARSHPALEEPILLRRFDLWSKSRFTPSSPVRPNKSTFKGLDGNVFAKLLCSPVRMDKLSRAVAPSDLLISVGIDENNILSAGNSSNFKGPKSYISLDANSLKEMQKKWPRLLDRMSPNVSRLRGPKYTPKNVKYEAVDYESALLDKIKSGVQKLGPVEADSDCVAVLDFSETPPPSPTALEDNLIVHFYVSSLVDAPQMELLKSLVSTKLLSETAKVKVGRSAIPLLIQLWRLYLYKN